MYGSVVAAHIMIDCLYWSHTMSRDFHSYIVAKVSSKYCNTVNFIH